jgi:hypothetical protein
MKRYIVHCCTGWVGSDAYLPLEMPDNHTEAELSAACWEMAVDHAQFFGYEEYPDDYDEAEDDGEIYSDGIDGHPELYDPAKHDMHRTGGGSFEGDF